MLHRLLRSGCRFSPERKVPDGTFSNPVLKGRRWQTYIESPSVSPAGLLEQSQELLATDAGIVKEIGEQSPLHIAAMPWN